VAASVRGAALASLGQLGDPSAVDVVLARFEDGDPMVRQIALIAAADLGDRRALGPLKKTLDAARAAVRLQLLAWLGSLAREEAAGWLASLAPDPCDLVGTSLADDLGSLERTEAGDSLAAMLEDRSVHVRRAAAIALARIGDAR